MADGLREPTRTAADEPRPVEPPLSTAPALAAKADDLEALRAAVIDAAGVSFGLWVSYLFVLFYLLVAAGGVTHRDLFFESPVKLPFLNVDLPAQGLLLARPCAVPARAHLCLAALRHARRQGRRVRCPAPGADRRSGSAHAAAPANAQQYLCAVSRRSAGGARRHHGIPALADRADQPGDRPGRAAGVLSASVPACPITMCGSRGGSASPS